MHSFLLATLIILDPTLKLAYVGPISTRLPVSQIHNVIGKRIELGLALVNIYVEALNFNENHSIFDSYIRSIFSLNYEELLPTIIKYYRQIKNSMEFLMITYTRPVRMRNFLQ